MNPFEHKPMPVLSGFGNFKTIYPKSYNKNETDPYTKTIMTWQRIQTLYLGIATALIAAMFFCRFATIIGPDGAEEFIRYYEKMPFLVLLIMLTSAHIAAIGCYKAFFLQARVSMIAGLLAIGFQIWLAIDFFRFMGQMTFSVTMLFPLAAAFLDFIAARASLVDEMTIQSIRAIKTKRRKR